MGGFRFIENRTKTRTPLAEVRDDKDKVHVTFEVPGMDKKDIHVHFVEGGLEVQAEHKEEEEKEGTYKKQYAKFYRLIPLPAHADTDQAQATYKNGILEVTMPTKELLHEDRKQLTVE